jgi:hypothetical protein
VSGRQDPLGGVVAPPAWPRQTTPGADRYASRP